MRLLKLCMLIACLVVPAAAVHAADGKQSARIKDTVDETVHALMRKHGIPGMAVALTVDGKRYFYNYGVSSRENGRAVGEGTLFEIGSISKTFTATLAAYAQAHGKLSLTDSAGAHLPALRGSSFDKISLLNLATHTSGGLPLQVPDSVTGDESLIAYLKSWQPAHAPGTQRTYSNVSIGVLGMIAAASLGMPIEEAFETRLFPALGMRDSYINVPAARMQDYAQGYTRKDAPVRMSPGILASEAYAVKSSATDMLAFVEANIDASRFDSRLRQALSATRQAYYTSGALMQGLIWEQYPWPVELQQVLAGNGDAMIYQPVPALAFKPASPPQPHALVNKTGSTNGFAAYVAFVPARKAGIVLLANKNYPIDARVTAAYGILSLLAGE